MTAPGGRGLWGGLSLRGSRVNCLLAGHHPTHVMRGLAPAAQQTARRRELILEFQSVCRR